MESIIKFILGNFNIWTPILALLLALISRKVFTERFLAYFLFFVVGLMGLQGFVMHAFFSEFSAKVIGWADSPFQYEVAIANLAFGVLGIIAYFRHYEFRLATGIGFTVWFFGDGVGHVMQLMQTHDYAPYNAGTTLYTDFLLPIIALFLLAIEGLKQRRT